MSEWAGWLKERAQENWVLNVCWQNVKPASLNYRTGDKNPLFSAHVNKHISFNSLSVRTVRRWVGGLGGLVGRVGSVQHSEATPCCGSRSKCHAKWKTPPAKSSLSPSNPHRQPRGHGWRKWTAYTEDVKVTPRCQINSRLFWGISGTENKSVSWLWK